VTLPPPSRLHSHVREKKITHYHFLSFSLYPYHISISLLLLLFTTHHITYIIIYHSTSSTCSFCFLGSNYALPFSLSSAVLFSTGALATNYDVLQALILPMWGNSDPFLWCELRVGIVVCGMDFFLRTLHPLFFFLIISISFLTLVYHRSMWYHFTRSVCLPNYHRCGRYSSVGSSIAHHSSTRPDPVRECCFVLWYWSEPVPFFFLTSLLLFTCLVVVATTIIDLAGSRATTPQKA